MRHYKVPYDTLLAVCDVTCFLCSYVIVESNVCEPARDTLTAIFTDNNKRMQTAVSLTYKIGRIIITVAVIHIRHINACTLHLRFMLKWTELNSR